MRVCDDSKSMSLLTTEVARSELQNTAHQSVHILPHHTFSWNIVMNRTAVTCGHHHLFASVLQNSKPLLLRKSMYEGTDIELKGRIFQLSSSYVIEIRFASITIACFFFKCCPFPVRRGWTSPFSGTWGTTPVTMNSSILRWVRETSAGDVCVLKVICPYCFQMLKWQFIICRKCMSERQRVVARAWIPTRWGRGSSSSTDTPQ